MRNREQYQDFLKCLSLFSEDIISKHELLNLIVDSLSRHPDLQVQRLVQDVHALVLLDNTLSVMLTHAVHGESSIVNPATYLHADFGLMSTSQYVNLLY